MGKFVISKTPTGCRFSLHAANGEIVATSEVYSTAAACEKGIQGVRKCAHSAPETDLTGEAALPANPRFEIFSDKAGSFRFRLRARNGKIILAGQPYSTIAACRKGIESVRKNGQTDEIWR